MTILLNRDIGLCALFKPMAISIFHLGKNRFVDRGESRDQIGF
jgi:hypothetical protein